MTRRKRVRLKVEIHVQNIEIQNTGHEIHGNTAKANYRNPSALAELALASLLR